MNDPKKSTAPQKPATTSPAGKPATSQPAGKPAAAPSQAPKGNPQPPKR